MNTRFAKLIALFLFVLFQQAQPSLSQAVDDGTHIKAILNTDGSYIIKGAASYYDLAFGGGPTLQHTISAMLELKQLGSDNICSSKVKQRRIF